MTFDTENEVAWVLRRRVDTSPSHLCRPACLRGAAQASVPAASTFRPAQRERRRPSVAVVPDWLVNLAAVHCAQLPLGWLPPPCSYQSS